MHRIFHFCVGFAITCFALPACSLGQIDFEKQIKPIFENHCIACHNEDEANGVNIAVKDEAMAYIYEEDAESSDLFNYLIEEDETARMPPPDVGRPLTEDQITLVKTWINEGAAWPDEVESDWKMVALPAPDESDVPYRAAGSLHPAVVHLPLGLLLGAGLFAFLSLRGNFVMSDCAYYCLWLGAIGGVFACASGWFFSEMEGYGTVSEVSQVLDQENKMFWHRITGLGATAFAIILALFASSSRNKDPDDGFMWKLGVILLAAAIGYVGHEGGKLTYGEEHYEDLYKLYEQVFPSNQKEDGDRTIDEENEIEVSEPSSGTSDEGSETKTEEKKYVPFEDQATQSDDSALHRLRSTA